MNTGLPRHLTVSDMPGCSEETSTSIEDSASVEASGRIWSMNGQANGGSADGAGHAGRDIEEIAAGGLDRVVCAHGTEVLLLVTAG